MTVYLMDIDRYKRLTITGDTVEDEAEVIMAWDEEGLLKLTPRDKFDSDMWRQWNGWKVPREKNNKVRQQLNKDWEEWKAKKASAGWKSRMWDWRYQNPTPTPQIPLDTFENPTKAYHRLMLDPRSGALKNTLGDGARTYGTTTQVNKLFIQAERLDPEGEQEDKSTIRFSFGTDYLTKTEIDFLNFISTGKTGAARTSFKTILINGGSVLAWEISISHLSAVIAAARKVWDVEVNALSKSTKLCTASCRAAEKELCVCVCGGSSHGEGTGTAPNEVIFGDLIVGTEYTRVTRYYNKK